MLDLDRFIRERPRLYHLAVDGAWPSIESHGLLSTKAIFSELTISEEQQKEIASLRKKQSVPLRFPDGQIVTIRDQKPLFARGLTKALNGAMTNDAWIALLNARVFLWPKQQGLARLRTATSYTRAAQIIVELDTRKLLDAYADQIEVSEINTGYSGRRPAARDAATFQPLKNYARSGVSLIREVSVLDRIDSVGRFVTRVTRQHPDGSHSVLVERQPNLAPSDPPFGRSGRLTSMQLAAAANSPRRKA